jgi:hypothetical protein
VDLVTTDLATTDVVTTEKLVTTDLATTDTDLDQMPFEGGNRMSRQRSDP